MYDIMLLFIMLCSYQSFFFLFNSFYNIAFIAGRLIFAIKALCPEKTTYNTLNKQNSFPSVFLLWYHARCVPLLRTAFQLRENLGEFEEVPSSSSYYISTLDREFYGPQSETNLSKLCNLDAISLEEESGPPEPQVQNLIPSRSLDSIITRKLQPRQRHPDQFGQPADHTGMLFSLIAFSRSGLHSLPCFKSRTKEPSAFQMFQTTTLTIPWHQKPKTVYRVIPQVHLA